MNPITITLPYPISANAYWRTRVIKPKSGGPALAMTYVSEDAKVYKQQVGWALKSAGIRKPMIGRVAIAYTLYPARPQDWQKRMRVEGATWDDSVRCIDLDNAQKVLLDAMKEIAFDDDKWVRKIVAERAEPDEKGARVVVTITSLAVEQPQESLFADLPT